MLIGIGAVIVILAIYLLVKQYETRMVLFCAGVSPMELAKRNAPGMIIAVIVSMFILL